MLFLGGITVIGIGALIMWGGLKVVVIGIGFLAAALGIAAVKD